MTITRGKKTRKRRHIDRKQRRQEQGKVQRQIDVAILELVNRTIEMALQDEATRLLGGANGER